MRPIPYLLVLLLVHSAQPFAEELSGKQIRVETGSHGVSAAPLSVPYAGPAPQGRIVVEDSEGKSYPATLREGELVFVVEDIGPNTTQTFVVKTRKGKKSRSVALKKLKGKDEVSVTIDGKLFTAYHYSPEDRKPFLWPVRGETGESLTRDWPMDPDGKSRDHVHHKSMWTAYGDVNGVDAWGEAGNKAGYQVTDELTWGSGDAYGWIHGKNTWQNADREPVLREEREYRFYSSPDPGVRLFDVTVTMTAAYGEVKFGDTKEGGIFTVRVRPEIQGNRKGVITNAAGGIGEGQCWGQPAAWCDYSGLIEGVGRRGITVFDHPLNLRHPTTWHVRDYGLMGANCFGLSYFTKGKQNGDYTLKEGESLTFKYRIYVHSGDVESANVAERYADYADAPKIAWGP